MRRIVPRLAFGHRRSAGFLLFSVLLVPHESLAQWPGDPAVNVAVCTATQEQRKPAIVSDGSGGAIIVWRDYRSGADYDIYAQRVDESGVALWTANGVAISTAAFDQYDPVLVNDGSGGAVIAWRDFRNASWDIYAQRINSSGVVQWTANGVPISIAADSQWKPAIAADGAGGAIITWYDYRSLPNTQIYVQHIDALGAVQWTADGVAITTGANDRYDPAPVSDGLGGVIIAWRDSRNGNMDIYAQRIDASGAVQWTANGVAVTTAAGGQYDPVIVRDGSDGAIITWRDTRNTDEDIFAQRVSGSGGAKWATDGVAVSTAQNSQSGQAIVSDGSGGAIVTWADLRAGSGAVYSDIYAQRIDSSGVVQWTADGAPVSTAGNEQDVPAIICDGSGGAVITWEDYRSGTNYDIYAQRIDASGVVQWAANGVAISTAANTQTNPAIVSDGSTGAVIAWEDYRSGANCDIYAQDVCAIVGGTSPVTVVDFHGEYLEGRAVISWSIHYVDKLAAFRLYSRRYGESSWKFVAKIEKDGTEYQYYDRWPGSESFVDYRLDAVDLNGQESTAGFVAVRKIEASDNIICQNRPNPFGRSTVISYALPARQHVTLRVFDILGHEVATLVDGIESAGVKSVQFDAGNLPSGIYTYRFSVAPDAASGDKPFVSVKKMLILK
ncbi:MAG: T9SS type A sorting domain-containing protein [Candidatus Eisenbacteria bacterium]|nr:T9SS type A sorting domain-containing protein [Candidatus Eisenbacteria bacterium]